MYVINLVPRKRKKETERGETMGTRFVCFAYTDMGLGLSVINHPICNGFLILAK